MVGIINNHIALPKAVLTGRRLLIMAKEKKRTDSYRRVLRQGESEQMVNMITAGLISLVRDILFMQILLMSFVKKKI